ncbi:hypothetical protein QTO34_006472 [Cnephaeus nilssonii]|uniref:Coiled-coil protein 142 C-terminal domain-containing protein n=1 Tax=Cnephaeus nilssonii TaxID=3371016 RepID=A0AA40LGQ7_CNENI|nr:hypothetical protein QTO34_006472 [Eptesicus nilssonii]
MGSLRSESGPTSRTLEGPQSRGTTAESGLESFLPLASLPQECEKELASLCHSLFISLLSGAGTKSSAKPWGLLVTRAAFPHPLTPLNFCSGSSLLSWTPFESPSQGCSSVSLQVRQAAGAGEAGAPPCTPCPGALHLADNLALVLGQSSAASGSLGPRFLPAPDPEGLTCNLCYIRQKFFSSLASEESLALEVEQQLGLEIRKLTIQIQLLPEESLSLFFQECYKQATQGFELHMPRGRYWRHRLCPELPSIPSEYAGLVVRTVLEPVLQGLQGLLPPAQAPALVQALTAILSAWLDHILTHGIRFSLQGTLQLRQDFGVVRELLEEERWGLSPELRQNLLMLSIFQQLDGALLCLLQQPLPKTQVHRRPPCCCACKEVQTSELPSSSLNSLESLEPPLRPGAPPAQTAQLLSMLWGGGPSPEAYLVGNQQAWLALRQHQRRPWWQLPFLSCLETSPEP